MNHSPLTEAVSVDGDRLGTRWSRPVVIAVVILPLAGGLTAFALLRSGHPGGDPGGMVLRELSPVASAVPLGSKIVDSRKNDAVWSPGCPDNLGGRAGWSGVEVLTMFKSTDSTQRVVRTVGTVLGSQGWTVKHPVDDAAWQYAPIAEWTRSLTGTISAKAVVFQYLRTGRPSSGPSDSVWMLGAEDARLRPVRVLSHSLVSHSSATSHRPGIWG